MKKNKKKNILVTFISVIMFFLGICIFLYPTVSNYLAEQQFKRSIMSYDVTNSKITEDYKTEEYEKAIKYNNSLRGDEVYDPFLPGSGYALPDNYNEVLNINGDGILGYIEIPKIKVRIPIYHGSEPSVLQKGIGHLQSTALPIGGVGNNSVLTGHRGLPSAELFTRLNELKKGDLIYISVLDNMLAYKVTETYEIEPGDISKLRAYKERDMITLITCTPYGINTHRLVVQADRTEYNKEEKEKIKPTFTFKLSETTIIRIVGIILGLIFLYGSIKILGKKKTKVIPKSSISKKKVNSSKNKKNESKNGRKNNKMSGRGKSKNVKKKKH